MMRIGFSFPVVSCALDATSSREFNRSRVFPSRATPRSLLSFMAAVFSKSSHRVSYEFAASLRLLYVKFPRPFCRSKSLALSRSKDEISYSPSNANPAFLGNYSNLDRCVVSSRYGSEGRVEFHFGGSIFERIISAEDMRDRKNWLKRFPDIVDGWIFMLRVANKVVKVRERSQFIWWWVRYQQLMRRPQSWPFL